MARIDLHTHSSASDGSRSPANLVEYAAGLHVDTLALTDHDTVAGVPSAIEAAAHLPLTIVPGIELSTEFHGRDLHMLGYFIDIESAALLDKLQWLRDLRVKRMLKIADRLRQLGYPIDEDRLKQRGQSSSIGRPHVARLMIDHGYVQSVSEAFQRFLARGKPAFVKASKISPQEAVQLVRAAGGAPTVAHPFTAADDVPAMLEELELVEHGLVGLEVYYGEYSQHQRQDLRNIADAFGLIPTGGSDYHSDDNKHGRKPGSVDVPDETVERLREASKSIQ